MASRQATKEEKTGETSEEVSEKVRRTTDAASQKAGEHEDYSAGKTKETKDAAAAQKAREAAQRAREAFQKKYQLTEDEARQKMEELKLRGEGIWDEDKQMHVVDVEKTPVGEAASNL